MMTYIQAKKF